MYKTRKQIGRLKSTLLIIKVIFFTIFIIPLCAQTLEKEAFEGGTLNRTGKWQIVFQDDFTGEAIDANKWYTFYPYAPGYTDQCGFCRTHDTTLSNQVFLDKNVLVSDGMLHLVTNEEKVSWMGYSAGFSSSVIHSKLIFNDYYKYEIRCKIPKGKGMWASFWMYGWSTELDMFEFFGKSTREVYMNVHKWKDNKSINKPKKYTGEDYAEAFHVFAVESEPYFVNFYIDEKLVHQVPKFVNRRGKYILKSKLKKGTYYLNPIFPRHGDEVAVITGNGIPRDKMAALSAKQRPSFPAVMDVDYVRVYKKIVSDKN